MLHGPEKERDSRKLKKVKELVQHFREQCNIMYQNKLQLVSIDESLRSIDYEAKERKGKRENCSLYKAETNLYKM